MIRYIQKSLSEEFIVAGYKNDAMTSLSPFKRTPRLRRRPAGQNGHPATRHLPAHISQQDGLPFYLKEDGRFAAQPVPQASLVHGVSPAEYYPERSESYLRPLRTTNFRDYVLFDDESRMLRDAALAPGPAPAEAFQIPSGGRFLLGMDADNLLVPLPGPGSYNPNKSEAAVTPNKSPCAAGWRQSPAPTPTEVAMVEGAKTAGPGTFLGLTKPTRVGSVSWGTGVAGRFDQQKNVDQTGPLLGPGTYSDVMGMDGFGRGGKSVIIRAEHSTGAMIRQIKVDSSGGGRSSSSNGMSPGLSQPDGGMSPKKRQAERERAALTKALQTVREQIYIVATRELQLDQAIEAKKEEFLRMERIRRRKQIMRRAGVTLGNAKKGFGFSNIVQEAFQERKRHERVQKKYREMKSRRKTASSEISDLLLKRDRLERAIANVPRYPF